MTKHVIKWDRTPLQAYYRSYRGGWTEVLEKAEQFDSKQFAQRQADGITDQDWTKTVVVVSVFVTVKEL